MAASDTLVCPTNGSSFFHQRQQVASLVCLHWQQVDKLGVSTYGSRFIAWYFPSMVSGRFRFPPMAAG
jgi:hypothetical protein